MCNQVANDFMIFGVQKRIYILYYFHTEIMCVWAEMPVAIKSYYMRCVFFSRLHMKFTRKIFQSNWFYHHKHTFYAFCLLSLFLLFFFFASKNLNKSNQIFVQKTKKPKITQLFSIWIIFTDKMRLLIFYYYFHQTFFIRDANKPWSLNLKLLFVCPSFSNNQTIYILKPTAADE